MTSRVDTLQLRKIREILDMSEYPFGWMMKNPVENTPDNMIQKLEDKLIERVYQPENQLENIMVLVTLTYEYCKRGKIEPAIKTLEIAGHKLTSSFVTLVSRLGLYVALSHIVMSCKAHLQKEKNELNATYVTSTKIPKLSIMDHKARAAIYGLRAIFYGEYGFDGLELALTFSKKANNMNPQEPIWHFFRGKYLGQLRRMTKSQEVPEEEELMVLEKAMEMQPDNVWNMIYLAQVYRESAVAYFRLCKSCINKRKQRVLKNKVNKLNKTSLDLYRKCVDMDLICPHMFFRIAKGFIMLPQSSTNEKMAIALLRKGLKLAPNSGFGNHVMAQYLMRIKKNMKEAVKHLKVAQNKKIFGAAMDLLRVEFKLDPNIDAVPTLLTLLHGYKGKIPRCNTYCQLISYNLFAKYDLMKACKYVNSVILLDQNCEDILRHRPIFIDAAKPINLYEIIIDEIKIQLNNSRCNPKTKHFFQMFLNTLSDANISVMPDCGPKYLKNRILRAAGLNLNNSGSPSKTTGFFISLVSIGAVIAFSGTVILRSFRR